jgi:hypothetical protein
MVVLLAWILVLLILKLWTWRKLRDIDGTYGIHKKNMNRPGGNVIGFFGVDRSTGASGKEDRR